MLPSVPVCVTNSFLELLKRKNRGDMREMVSLCAPGTEGMVSLCAPDTEGAHCILCLDAHCTHTLT